MDYDIGAKKEVKIPKYLANLHSYADISVFTVERKKNGNMIMEYGTFTIVSSRIRLDLLMQSKALIMHSRLVFSSVIQQLPN